MFGMTTTDGTATGDIANMLAAVEADTLVHLPAMQAHQRPGVVTGLAVAMAALRLYSDRPRPWDAGAWRAEWDAQLGPDARREVASLAEVALFQPPVADPKRLKPVDLLSADCGFLGAQHAAKGQGRAAPEAWLLAILSGASRPHANFNPAGVRALPLVVLPTDGTLAGEVRWLAEALEAGAVRGAGAKDHMPWLLPLGGAALRPSELPRPFLDLPRTVRLLPDGTAVYEASNERRVDGRQVPLVDDPHAPVQVEADRDARPYRLVGQREWSHVAVHAALAGRRTDKATVSPARILGLVAGYPAVRVCGLRGEQGKTMGYREVVLAAPPQALDWFAEAAGGGGRPGELSAAILDRLAAARGKVLWPALAVGLRLDKALVAARLRELDAEVGMTSVQLLLDLLGREPDRIAEQTAIHRLARDGVGRVFDRAAGVRADPLAVAHGGLILDRMERLELPLPEAGRADTEAEHVSGTEEADTTRQVFGILKEIDGHLTPSDRASLRTAGRDRLPMCAWSALARVPDGIGGEELDEVWLAAIETLGAMQPSSGAIGRVLAATEYPELRMRKLLAARGAALRAQCGEALRWLAARRVERAPLGELVALEVADALDDRSGREGLVRAVALGYVREVEARARRERAA